MFRSKTLALIILVLILGVVGVNLLKSGITPDETGIQGSDNDMRARSRASRGELASSL
jgi:hypothetical protein